jgi:lysine 2,3-aminomutase
MSRNPDARGIVERPSVERLWAEDEALCRLLAESDTKDEAADRVWSYLDDLEAAFRAGAFDVDRVERSSALRWIDVFKDVLSPENESIAGFSTLDLLWRAVRGEGEEVSSGFVAEFSHVFRAIAGRSGVGRGWMESVAGDEEDRTEFAATGRRAAVSRSNVLDRLASALWARVAVYKSGLDRSVCRERARNRGRILARLGGSENEWDSWAWQAEHVLKGEAGAQLLGELVALSGEERAAIRLAVRYRIPWGITPYYLSLFDFASHGRRFDGQVRAQVIPPLHTVRAMIEHRADRGRALDFMGERDTSPIDRVTRRYPSVAIFKVSGTCPQICTYCQRNWEIDEAMVAEHLPTRSDLEPALRWFEDHPAITDVLLTGGDPLLLQDDLLAWLLGRLSEADHISHIRVGTRMPVTMPMRITDALAEALRGAIDPGRRAVSVVTHVESASEVTPELADAVDRLRRRGIGVYNQQVFTLEVSRRFEASAARIALRRAGVDPYYTFYTKGKDEHRDYLVPIARVAQERKEEARLLPGIFRTDEPVFNVPRLGKNHLRAQQDRELIGIRSDGRRVYLFHPWEKGIAPVAPWPYVDASILEYLERLRRRGEDPAEYESIWYYI